MKLKDMTIEQLRKYEEIKTCRPRQDMILVKDLRKWFKAHIDKIQEDIMKCMLDEDNYELSEWRVRLTAVRNYLIKISNLEGKV